MHDAWLGRESKVLFICSCGTICCTQDTLPVERRLWGIWNLQVWPIINSPEDEATCAALTWQSWMLRTSLQHGRVKRVSSWQPSIVHTRTGSYLWRSWHELLSLCTHVELCVHILYVCLCLGCEVHMPLQIQNLGEYPQNKTPEALKVLLLDLLKTMTTL